MGDFLLPPEPYYLMGWFPARILGKNYYHGGITPKQRVVLAREPQNPVDTNAVVVHNTAGEQLGYLNKELAALLAEAIDKGYLLLQGMVPGLDGDRYSYPIHVYCFAPQPTSLPQRRRTLGNRHRLVDRLAELGITFECLELPEATAAAKVMLGSQEAALELLTPQPKDVRASGT